MTAFDTAEQATAIPGEQRAALDAVTAALGEERVVVHAGEDGRVAPGGLGANTGFYRQRRTVATIRPGSVEDVRKVVWAFGESPESGSLHAYSTGHNWGLGSREPATDDVVTLDLSGLDQVRAMDVDAGWAVIEPGVTQGKLAALVDGTARMVNVTASSAHSSVLGNAMDRGVGLRHQRDQDVVGLEVVCPDGEVMHVGWWPDAERQTPVYPHGLGPSLVQLFVQSNLGVVTGAAIRLLPRPEALRVVRLTFTPENLGPAVAKVRRWVTQNLASGVTKIYNPPAALGYGNHPDRFLAHVCVDGTAESVAAITRIIAEEAVKSGLFTEISATDSIEPASPHHKVTSLVERSYLGDPDVTDTVFEQKMGGIRADQLDDELGFLFFLPLVPFTPEALVEAEALLREVTAQTGITCGGTGNVLGPDLVDFVVAMKFARDEDTAGRAREALDLLHEKFVAAGFVPYRLDVDHTGWLERCDVDPAARRFVRTLKQATDPTRVIAPGRYH